MIIPALFLFRVQVFRVSVLLAVLAVPSVSSGQIACLNYDEYLHRVGRVETPRMIWTTVVNGNHAYLGDDHGDIHVVDISNPQAPAIVGYLDAPGSAEGLAISGTHLFVASWVNGLQVIDISNPTSPAWVTELHIPSAAADLAINGNYLYIAAADSGLQVVDISNPSLPEIVGDIQLPVALKIAVKDTLAYVVGLDLQIIDVSEPTTPEIAGTLDLEAYSIHLTESLALVGSGAGFKVINVSDPSLPVVIGSSDPLPGYAAGLDVVGDLVFVAYGQTGFRVFNISDPSSPIWVNDTETFSQANDVVVIDGRAYLSIGGGGLIGGKSGLEILDVTQPIAPSFVGTAPLPGGEMRVMTVSDNYVYGVGSGALFTFDVSNPTSPLIELFQAGGLDIAVAENRAYIAGGTSGFRVVDLSNPMSPALLGCLETPGVAVSVALDGDIAYVADGDSGLQVIDVSIPEFPVLIARLNFLENLQHITVSGSYAYLSQNEELVVVDVSDPQNPLEVGALPVTYANEMVVIGNVGYLASFLGLSVLDLTLPSSPQVMSHIDLPGQPRRVAVEGDLVYVLGGGTQIIEVSDPYSPRFLGSITTKGSGGGMATGNGYVYVGTAFEQAQFMVFPAQCSVPTPVELSAFTAEVSASGIHLHWTLTDKTQASGFHVHRSKEAEGVYDRLTTPLLPGTGPHEFLDRDILPGTSYSYRLEAVDRSGFSSYFGPVTARMESIHPRTRLDMSRPNPFGGNATSTVIAFELAQPAHVRLIVYDAAGRRVRTLIDGKLSGGANSVSWDGLNDRGQLTAPGLYFYRLDTVGFSQTHRMVRLN